MDEHEPLCARFPRDRAGIAPAEWFPSSLVACATTRRGGAPGFGREGNVAWMGRIGAIGEHIPESQREGRYRVQLLDPGCDRKRTDVGSFTSSVLGAERSTRSVRGGRRVV
jgi:hypothetical protein